MATRSSRLGAVLFFLASTACGTSSSLVTSDDAALQTATSGADGGAPPQAAVDACADLTLDDDCTFVGHNGKTVSGTCQDVPGGELACVPAGGAGCAQGQGGSGGQGGGQHPGPPPGGDGGAPPPPPQEAVDACASLAADDACSFSGAGGETVSGTCKTGPDGTGALACAPARDAHQGPPAEAIEACTNSAVDAACTFTHGSDSVTGTCKYGPDGDTSKPLACAPTRPQS